MSAPKPLVVAPFERVKTQRIQASVTSPYVKLMGHDIVLSNGIPEANLEALKEVIAKSPMGDSPIGQDILRACVELQVRRASERMNANRLKVFIRDVDPGSNMFDLRGGDHG